MSTYRLNVREILDAVGGSIRATDEFDVGELVVGDVTFTMHRPAHFDVTISNAGEAFVSTGRIVAEAHTTCSRCLCEFDTNIEADVEGYWPRPGHEVPEAEDVTGEVDLDGFIDLEPALMAALVVEAPFAPLHDESCAGLCATCGADLNAGPCECPDDPTDEGAFSALADMVAERPDTQGGG